MTALKSLLVIGLFFTAAGFSSGYLGDIIGPIDYTGYLVFEYPIGENPITNIVFTVDSKLSNNLIITNVPSPWSNSYSDGVLMLSGGSLSPGSTISVTVSLNKYIKAGEYPVSSVGTTTTGESSQAIGVLVVGELILLNALGILSAYRLYLTGGLLGIGFIEWILTKRLLKPVQTYPDKVLTPSDLEEIRDSLPSDLPEGGKIVIDQGMGLTSDGELIQLDDNTPPKSFSEESGLEVETSPIDYRDGLDSGSSPRKMSGLPKYGNITMKRPSLDEPNWEKLVEESRGRIPIHSPEWTDHAVEDPGVTFVDLLGWLYNERMYRLEFSPTHFDFLKSHSFTGGELKRLVIDSVTGATEKGESLKIEHVKSALIKMEK